MTNVVIDPFEPSRFSMFVLKREIKVWSTRTDYKTQLKEPRTSCKPTAGVKLSIRAERGHVGVFRDILRIRPSWCFSEPA